MQKIIISDPTLRDGNHAASHQLNIAQIEAYCKLAEDASIDIIEVGHGNGLGASSLQLGLAAISDKEMLITAKKYLKNTRLSVHVIPGFARIDDLSLAIDNGVDIIRVASHCTEADTTERYLKHARHNNITAHGVLMMSHMATKEKLLSQAQIMVENGAEALILMDSAGAYLPSDVREKISYLRENLSISLGFHAHNNLSLAIANSIEAAQCGATIIDATMCGLGAGAGNTALEIVVAVLNKMGFQLKTDQYKIFDMAEIANTILPLSSNSIKIDSLISSISGVFSGFAKPVRRIAERFNVSAYEIYRILGERKVVAGQEDLIIEIAQELQGKSA